MNTILLHAADAPHVLRPQDVQRVVDEATTAGVRDAILVWLKCHRLIERTRDVVQQVIESNEQAEHQEISANVYG